VVPTYDYRRVHAILKRQVLWLRAETAGSNSRYPKAILVDASPGIISHGSRREKDCDGVKAIELQRLLGKKTLEAEILKEAFEHDTVAEVIGVSRSNLIERTRERPKKRIGRPPLPDDKLVAEIKAGGVERPPPAHSIATAVDLVAWSVVYLFFTIHGRKGRALDRYAVLLAPVADRPLAVLP
jgi:hypothetical protein